MSAAARTRLELTPAGRVALLLALGASAAALEPGLARPLAALGWALLALAAARALARVRGLALALPRAARGPVGARLELVSTLRARAPRSGAWGLALVAGADETPLPAALVTGTLGPAPAELRLAWRVRRRGRETELGARITAADPLGLVRAVSRTTLPCDLLGLPRRGTWLGERARAGARSSALRGRMLRGDEELVSVRDWRPGESLRRLHWRLSARRGRAIVRELATPAEGELVLVLDTALDEPDRRARRAAFERAVSLTATLAEHHLGAGRRVDLCIGARVSARALRGRRGLARALALLAEAAPEATPPAPAATPDSERILVRAGRGRPAPEAGDDLTILDVDAAPGEPHHAPWRAPGAEAAR